MPYKLNPFTGQLDFHDGAGTATTVVSETGWGQAADAGSTGEHSDGGHTHGTPDLPVAGLDKHVQFNDGGAFGSDEKFEWDKTVGALKIGDNPTLLPNNPLSVQANVDSYAQINFQNTNTGEDASADYILTADDGDDTNYWADFGICNSGYASMVWDVATPHDGYIFIDGGHCVIGTLTPLKKVKIFVSGTSHEAHPADVVAEIDADGVNLATGKTYRVNGIDITQTAMSNPMTASGDMIYGGTSGAATALAKGTDGEILTLVGGVPSWEPNSGSYADEDAQDAVGAMADVNTLSYTDTTPSLAVKRQMSIDADSNGLMLSGDSASPGNNMVYGTTGAGVKGWKADPAGGAETESIGVTIDGSGTAITTGSKGYREIPYACTITGWTIIGKESGNVVVDVKRCTYAGFPTTSSVAGSEKPTLSSAQKNQDLSLTTWTTAITAGDILEFVVDSASTVTRVHLFIRVTKS